MLTPPPSPTVRPSLVGMTRSDLAAALAAIGVAERERKMRVAQLWHWIYFQGARTFDVMLNVGKGLRADLAAAYTLERPEVVTEQVSADGTRKWLIRLAPDAASGKPAEIECVYIPESDRGTLCVSSQVGCTLTCSFCHTGTQKLVRNLTTQEIVAQLVVARDKLGDFPGLVAPTNGLVPTAPNRAVSNLVFMGMGEPLYNFEAVRDAIGVLSDGDGLSLSRRRITVSTAGVVPKLPALGEEAGAMLAISLHAVRDDLRDTLVPLNRKYPLRDLAGRVPRLSRRLECAPYHLRIRDAEGRQRQPGRGARPRAAPQGRSGEDQPHSVQSLARHDLRMFRLGGDRTVFRHRLQRRLCEPRPYAARPRYSRCLRPAEKRNRKAARPRPPACARLT